MAANSKKSVIAAIAGNTIVMFAKCIGFFFTGSSSMLAESIHSFADVLNQSLLLIGMNKSEKSPDTEHATGYGRERFIWSLISAVGIFFLGCGVTVYHGVSHLLHPTPHEDYGLWPFFILLFSLAIEGWVFYIAWKSIAIAAEDKPFWKYLRKEADPSAVAVFMEDAAACFGIIIALMSIALTSWTHETYWDAIGSITIGVLLGVIAIWLIQRNRELLVGQRIPEQDMEKLQQLLKKGYLGKVDHIRSEVIGAEQYDIQVEIEVNERKLVETIPIALQEEYEKIQNFDDFTAFAQKLSILSMEHLTSTIDQLEAEIQEELPRTRFIDIEPN